MEVRLVKKQLLYIFLRLKLGDVQRYVSAIMLLDIRERSVRDQVGCRVSVNECSIGKSSRLLRGQQAESLEEFGLLLV